MIEFSVLMTTYYKETPENLDLSLCSITDEQSIMPNQIVLVLDGPVGNEIEEVVGKYEKKYPDIIDVVRLEENVGQGAASAEGIKFCRYKYVARMDSDDISMYTRFEEQIAVFQDKPEISVVAGFIGEFEYNPNDIRTIRKVPKNHDDICRLFRFRNPINNVTAMYKIEALKKAGGYNKERANEDFSLYVRMLTSGSLFYNIQNILVKVKVGSGMKERRGDINIFRAWCKNQKVLLKYKRTNVFLFALSCVGCLFFVVTPPNVKQFLYQTFLRSKG